jgi:3-hydroxybutyryl-CoA dehydrogenase
MHPLRTIAVLGAGTMGRGIAQVCAVSGLAVRLHDVATPELDAALRSIKSDLEKLVGKGKLDPALRDRAIAAIEPSAELEAACSGAELVIEAAPEMIDLKVELLGRARRVAGEHAILASNTSSLSITEIGRRIEAGARCVGLHFFNPPPVMPLLEIVRGLSTEEAVMDRCASFAARIGKQTIVVRDYPGFATSRLGVVIGAEAMRMLETGVASVADIDRAMELGYRHPMGPLKLTDLVGLDVRLAILEHLQHELGEQFRPPAILRQMVRAGRLGKKVGIGFYRWTDDGPVPAA